MDLDHLVLLELLLVVDRWIDNASAAAGGRGDHCCRRTAEVLQGTNEAAASLQGMNEAVANLQRMEMVAWQW